MEDKNALSAARSRLIFSASGWRGVFAGGEESREPGIDGAFAVIAAAAGTAFARFLAKRTRRKPLVILGMDTRPTGPALFAALSGALLGEDCEILPVGVTAAPEIMAFARSCGEKRAGGFVYISASHNPIGHNGLKFGLFDGGVLGAAENKELLSLFDQALEGSQEKTGGLLRPARAACRAGGREKKRALAAYRSFIRSVAGGDGITPAALCRSLRRAARARPCGVVCDFNGSARAASIDRAFFAGLGVAFAAIHETPGEIVHRIVPEGEALEPCRRFLEEERTRDRAFSLGYVPDCDGDRGNLVIWDEAREQARALEAQEVFALACLSELSHLRWAAGQAGVLEKTAVAVNDATSMRIDRIAESFGARVFRAEVGEANVVSLARRLRSEGWTVRILGEGAAGGSITHPSAVRDPLCTVLAVIKLLLLPGFWRERPPDSLSELIAALPRFVTTSTYSESALLSIETADHAALKRSYQRIFCAAWEEMRRRELQRRGIVRWRAFCYNGTEEQRCDDDFGRSGRGGLKINLLDSSGRARAALWMRGSATEPVFRVMADVEGADEAFERTLIAWQRRMTCDADNAAAGGVGARREQDYGNTR
jgi:phosphoglucomutase